MITPKKYLQLIVFLLGIIFFLSACSTVDSISYLQGINANNTKHDFVQVIDTKIKIDDQLYIFVSSNNIELASIYNLPNFSVASANMQQGSTQGNPVLGYVVGPDSAVILPKIGKVCVVGLSQNEAENLIASKLSNMLKEPIVHVRLINFKVSVLGDVKNPGTFNVSYNKINLLQAIGLAGDLNITGCRQNVLLVRNENGKTITKNIDLTERDALRDKDFWLQNGDIIYVQPNKQKMNTSRVAYQSWPMIISTATLVFLIITNLSK